MQRIRGLLIFYAVVTVIAGVIALADLGGGEMLIALASGVGLIISAIVDALIADLFSKLAEDKGYNGSVAFWLSFWMSCVGYLYVCAMPDKSVNAVKKTAPVMNEPVFVESDTKKCVCVKCGANIGNSDLCPECGSSMKMYIYD